MLWFNQGRGSLPKGGTLISIHLMLWFNFDLVDSNKNLYQISIHLMLWFNHNNICNNLPQKNFNTSYVVVQPCASVWLCGYFNTSYVVVQQLKKKSLYFYCLNFNTSYVVVQLEGR